MKVTTISRYLLGLIFFVFGLNGFLQFLPAPPLPESALAFIGGLASAPYFFPVLKGTEVITGLLLLTGIAAPVALVILAPISLQIFLFGSLGLYANKKCALSCEMKSILEPVFLSAKLSLGEHLTKVRLADLVTKLSKKCKG